MPADQEPNPYIVDALNLDFHYFFMRKLWFVQLACAVVFPGGYGTLDELAELLTLIQTGRSSGMPLGLLGNEYGDDILDLQALERWGTIDPQDLDLIHRCDTPGDAFDYLRSALKNELS